MRRLLPAALILFILPGSSVFADEPSTSITIDLQIRSKTDATPSGTLTLRSVSDGTVTREIPLRGVQLVVWGRRGAERVVSVSAPGWWSPELRVTFPANGLIAPYKLDVWRTAILTANVVAGEKNFDLPKEMALIAESPPTPTEQREIARGTKFPCSAQTPTLWSCVVPATSLDLVLRVPTATPHYRWGVRPLADQKMSLGTFTLKRGASLVAWLDSETAKRLTAPAKARLIRPVADPASQTSARLSVPVAESVVNSRGWVQLSPLPPGTYVLEISATGFAPAQIAPVEIYEGKESALRRGIELFPPLTVDLRIDPPLDVGGSRWKVEWERQADFASSPASAVPLVKHADERGNVTIENQIPGTFFATVQDQNGNRLWSESVQIATQEQAQVSVKLKLHNVIGKLFLGDDPLSATLWFGGSDADIRAQMKSDESGEFHGRLPRSGSWEVEVVNAERHIRAVLTVDVQDTEDALEIRLPDTKISGWVVDADGERVKRGSIAVISSGHAFSERLESDGTFLLRGLAAGVVSLLARDLATGDAAPSTDLQLQENQTLRDVRLQIEPSRLVAGTVRSLGSPLAGARVTASSLDLAGQRLPGNAVSDVTGRFELRLATRTRQALVVVAAPSRTLQSFDVLLEKDAIVLDVAPVGGTIEISADAPISVTRNGVPLPVDHIYRWISAHGQVLTDTKPLRIPDLAPGHYRACLASGKCAEGTLAPRGLLALNLTR
ncbi:MAG TPA: carboxypeptidase-like regulatory domain-containing protein [Thermoanaerobaculia bacterium]|nr:carboxypeptidase-like regulatory domain-containing protein [Thermoanaerobaculia bacterium]